MADGGPRLPRCTHQTGPRRRASWRRPHAWPSARIPVTRGRSNAFRSLIRPLAVSRCSFLLGSYTDAPLETTSLQAFPFFFFFKENIYIAFPVGTHVSRCPKTNLRSWLTFATRDGSDMFCSTPVYSVSLAKLVDPHHVHSAVLCWVPACSLKIAVLRKSSDFRFPDQTLSPPPALVPRPRLCVPWIPWGFLLSSADTFLGQPSLCS